MIKITGYTTQEVLHEGAYTTIIRATKDADDTPVILKCLPQGAPEKQSAHFRHEAYILEEIDSAKIVRFREFFDRSGFQAIAIEDDNASSLDIVFAESRPTLKEMLTISVGMLQALSQLHSSHIIHRNINPANVIYNPKTQTLKLIDFDKASKLTKESLTPIHPDSLEGDIRYISPEQTGRMNRSVDFRTDLYSVGATMYFLLTGRPPFEEEDPHELLNLYISQAPEPPHLLDRNIPKALSSIVQKLMARYPEDRYRSTFGPIAELNACLEQIEKLHSISEIREPEADIPERLLIPEKLYGRVQQTDELIRRYGECAQGISQIVLVVGYSGIGKTSLVRELNRPITAARGYFVSGKFDQFQRDIPYSVISRAVQDLVRQILTESDNRIKAWKEKISGAVKDLGQLIIEVVPELELIIGKQSSVPELPPVPSQNRFNLVFIDFLKVFCKKEHPLCVFLDDLQWVDYATLELIELIMNDDELKFLYIIGAYRDNEVDAAHPFALMKDRLGKHGVPIAEIKLFPLDKREIVELISDSLYCYPQDAQELAEFLHRKTEGNPFFAEQYLEELDNAQMLDYDPLEGIWTWDINDLRNLEVAGDIVSLMAYRISRLNDDTQKVLQVASCMGNRFMFYTLHLVSDMPLNIVAQALQMATSVGLVMPIGTAYLMASSENPKGWMEYNANIEFRFSHDRIQAAAYSCVDAEFRTKLHHQIGTLLLRNTSQEEQDIKLFEFVNQLNLSTELIKEQNERDELAAFNVRAAKKSKASAAYYSALQYYLKALELIGDDALSRNYEIAKTVYLGGAESALLSRDEKSISEFTDPFIASARNEHDAIEAYAITIQDHLYSSRYHEAIETALFVLKTMGIKEKTFLGMGHRINQEKKRVKKLLKDKIIEELVSLPESKDKKSIALLSIIDSIIHATHIYDQELAKLLLNISVAETLEKGISKHSPFAFVSYGYSLCVEQGDADLGVRFADIAIQLGSNLEEKEVLPKVQTEAHTHLYFRKKPISESITPLQNAFAENVIYGLFNDAGDAMHGFFVFSLFGGKSIEYVTSELRRLRPTIDRINLPTVSVMSNCVEGLCNALTSNQDQAWLAFCSENDLRKSLKNVNERNEPIVSGLYFYYVFVCVMFGEYQRAMGYLPGVTLNRTINGSYFDVLSKYYSAIAMLGVYPYSTAEERKSLEKKYEPIIAEIGGLAKSNPLDFEIKHAILLSDEQAALGNHNFAIKRIEQIMDTQSFREATVDQAMAHEKLARLYKFIGERNTMEKYATLAIDAYQKWGAQAKVRQIRKALEGT